MNGTARFLFEVGMLKRLPRAGWLMAGVPAPESVAEHSFRTAVLGYILAGAAGADAPRTAMMCLCHDLHEARIGDLHALAKRYIDASKAEHASVADQTAGLPEHIGAGFQALSAEFHDGQTLESRLARDADRLECLLQALEYQSQGNHNLQEWITTSQAALQTDAAKALAAECLQASPAWWRESLSDRKNLTQS